MKPILPFLLVALLSGATAVAQPTFRLGLRGGLNRATSTVAATSNSPSTYPFSYSATKSALNAWQAGAVLEVAFRHFAVQPALVFSQKGEQFNTYEAAGFQRIQETQQTSRPNWVEMPVNAVYTLHNFQLFAGPYVALAVGGRQHSSVVQSASFARFAPYEFDGKIYYGSGTENRRLDAGVNFGLGYRQGPMQVQLGYGLGLRNLRQQPYDYIISENPYYHEFNADASYNRVLQVTGTYFLEL